MKQSTVFECDGFYLQLYSDEKTVDSSLSPILVTFALVNTTDILDIAPKRSFINHLIQLGFRVFLIVWKVPTSLTQEKSLEDYVLTDINMATQIAYKEFNQTIILLGVCQGGYFNLCYSLVKPDNIKALVLMVTPIDFHVSKNRIYQMLKYVDIERVTQSFKTIPGNIINQAIFSASPFLFTFKKMQLYQKINTPDEANLVNKIEKWAWSCPTLSKQAFIQFVKNCIQENALISGTLTLANQKILLKNLRIPLLNIYAKADPIWPMSCSSCLVDYVPRQLYQEYRHEGGHIGVMVSKRGLKHIPQHIYNFTQAVL